MTKAILLLVVIVLIPISFWGIDVLNDRKAKVEIVNEVEAYENWDLHSSGNALFKIAPGEKVKVLRVRYGKDFMSAKVRNNLGNEGWVYYHGENAIIYWPKET